MRKFYRLRYAFWLILPLVAAWIWYRITQTDVTATLASFRLNPYHLLGLVAFNAAILFLFNSRWWLILRAQGFRVPYLATVRYRMAAFALSYFTPGMQFGGEPLQVYALHSRHGIPTSKAVASVTLDKLFELLSNFSFLALGAALVLRNKLRVGLSGETLALLAAGLLLLPVIYLVLISAGRMPLYWLAARINDRLPERMPVRKGLRNVLAVAGNAERQMAAVIRQQPSLIFQALAASLLIWAASMLEYWLALRVLGVRLTLPQTVLALTAARLAFLTPLPGGIGALEASQMLAMRVLHLSPLTGFAISLWIRGRDIALGAIGAAMVSVLAEPDAVQAVSTSAGD